MYFVDDRVGGEMGKGGAVTIYGIRNCDTMKKARAWLDGRGVPYVFHDYKVDGIDRGRLEAGAREVGWETLLRSEEHTSELQSLMRKSYAVCCLKKTTTTSTLNHYN